MFNVHTCVHIYIAQRWCWNTLQFKTMIIIWNVSYFADQTLLPLLNLLSYQLQQQDLFRMKLSKQPFKIGTAERKVLIIFCYYVLLFVIALTTFTDFTRTFTGLGTKLAEYWQCELSGVDSENACDEMKTSFHVPGLTALSSISYILLGLLPAVNLIFAVNINELRQKFRTLCGRITKLYSIEEPSTSSTVGTSLTLRRE